MHPKSRQNEGKENSDYSALAVTRDVAHANRVVIGYNRVLDYVRNPADSNIRRLVSEISTRLPVIIANTADIRGYHPESL